MASPLNVMKIYQLVQKLLVDDTQTAKLVDRQHDDLIRLNFLFKENGIKSVFVETEGS
jgi:hypothetical protein